MAIVHLGAKRIQGTKVDRVSDSLGSSVDGTNNGITVTGGKIARPSGASWDFTNILYSGKNYDVSSKENQPATCTFKTDGTKFYVVGEQNATIYEFTCSTAWDVSTASYTTSKTLQKTTNYGGNTPQNCGIAFKSDGTKCFVCERNDETIHEYALSSAWDISTLNTTHTDGFSVSSQTSNPRGVWVNSDGTKFYVPSTMNEGSSNDTVFQYTCSTGWDLTTASYASKSKDYSSKIANGVDFAFNNDGTKCYVLNLDDDGVFQFTVDTAYDVTTIDLTTSEFLNTNAEDTTPLGFYIEPTQKKIFIAGLGNDKVSQYSDEYYGAYSFDGSDDYITAGSTTDFTFLHDGGKNTITFWLKKDTPESGDVREILGTADGTSNGCEVIYLDRSSSSETRRVKIEFTNASSQQIGMYYAQEFFPNDSNWHHYAIVTDLSNSYLKAYVDGVEKTADSSYPSFTGTPVSTAQQHVLNIGRRNSGTFYLDGDLDDLSFWDRNLSTTEITALYNSGTGASVSTISNKAGLKAHYSMDSTDVNTVSDTATYTEDMSDTTGWAFADTGANNVTGGSLSYSLKRDGSNDAASYDFGATISNKFTLRFSHTPTAQSHSSGSNCIGFFGLSDNTSGQGTSQDFIGFNFASNDSDGATTKNNTTLVANSVTGQASNSHTSGTKYYEIKRNSATEVVFTVYNNSDFTGVYRTQTESSLSSSITGLRYFKFANWHSSGSGSCSVTGTIDDLQLWDHEGCKNDASSTSELDGMTNLPTNTLFLQTDDTPSYWWKQSDNTWKLDGHTNIEPSLTDSSVWSMVGKQTGSATTTLTGGKLKYTQATNHGTADSGAVAVYDTGSTTDKFVMRFNFTTGSSHTDGGGNANLFWGLSSNGSYSSSQGFNTGQTGNSADAIAFRWHIYSNKTRIAYYNGGSISWGTDPNESLTFTNNTTYYWELSFDGSTTTLKRFTDSTYSSATHTGTQTSVSGVSGLRYLVIGGTIDSQMGVFTIDHNKFEIQKGRSTWLE